MGNECPRLKPEVLEDLQQCTSFTPEEITDWYLMFIRDNPRGQITLEEFKEIHQTSYLYGDSSMYAEHLFRAHDNNRDGVIDFKEFLTYMNVIINGSLESKLKMAFKVFDIDGDGYISRAEMTRVVRSLYKIDFMTIPEDVAYRLSRKQTATAFVWLDRNCDGKISLEEFVEGAMCDMTILYLFQFQTECYRFPLPRY